MGTLQSLRKAYGALKDSTKVGLAKVNSEFKDLDIAIVKATNHVEGPPKERHVRKVFAATSGVRPQADVAYCIHSLARRLGKTRNWVVALKTLIVIHRTLREGEPTFREELLNYSHRGHVLRLSNFKDDSSPLAWDCSAWVRTYALFLEERLECFRVLKYDIEAERLTKSSDGPTKGHCRTRNLASEDLLEHLPALQQLLHRLVGCQPDGGAFHNYLIQYALALVLKESFKIYCAINDGIINLVDMFFEMSRHEAVKALEIYRRAGQQAANLSDFYESCKGLDLARNFQFPTLRQPPPSFLTTMEEYIREAPRTRSVSNKTLEYQETKALPYKPEEASPSESQKSTVEADAEALVEAQESPQPENEVPSLPVVTPDTGDLLGLNDINPNASEIELSNALSLAIVSPDAPKFSESGGLMLGGSDPSGWELALVTTTSSNSSHVAESKLAGGFDRLLLDSLYDHAVRPQNAGYGAGPMANPFDQQDPFSMSNHIAPPPNVQMAVMAQQQQQHQQPTMVQNPHYPLHQPEHQPQQMMMMQHPHYPLQTQQQMMQNHYQPQQQVNSANPFGDPFTSFPPSAPHGNPNLI